MGKRKIDPEVSAAASAMGKLRWSGVSQKARKKAMSAIGSKVAAGTPEATERALAAGRTRKANAKRAKAEAKRAAREAAKQAQSPAASRSSC